MKRRDFLAGAGRAAGLLAAMPLLSPAATLGASSPTVRTLKARPGAAKLVNSLDGPTRIWGYEGINPGPLLRFRQGDTLRLTLSNALPQPTSVHWHGLRVPNAMDGVSGLTQEAVPNGQAFEYIFDLRDAGTFWYHAHNRSWEQMARGLHGMLIVDEREPPPVDHDLTFVIDDWRLDRKGQIDAASFGRMPDWAHGGRLGNWVTVNGRPNPTFPVMAGDRVRLRILNAANARIMALDFPNHEPVVIALDGQPTVPKPIGKGPLIVAPGQRADLMIDMALAPGASAPVELRLRDRSIAVARFVYAPGTARRANALDAPVRLEANPLPETLDLANAEVVALRMEGGAMGRMMGAMMGGRMLSMRDLVAAGKVWAFNGVAGMPDRPLLRIAHGRSAVVEIDNANAWPHAMHLHGHHFKVVRRNGQGVADSPWRDTELVAPGERVSIAFAAETPGKWLLHCHMLEHQAGGMATWIEIA